MKNSLSQLRQARGLTQQELGDWVGVSRQSIISLETGRYNPSLEVAHRLALFFGMKIEELFIFEDVPSDVLTAK
jgi:putative transcriptional regulator